MNEIIEKENIIIEEGYPRNDFLINYTYDDIDRIKKDLNIQNINKAIDNIDGEIKLYISEDVSKLKKGTHNLKLKSIDASGNITYKDVVIKIYSDNLVYMWYYLCLVILIVMVIIIYIYRFKKKIIF